ncbi:hypothetical protein HNR39_001986 [Glaciimonas immobilis]|uniref:Uncharacterized protein n=1 Tax=Glaciimonas immobilis TaxID=728004 RepID=A0A840RU67_9BURK|nr:hypothetical protein [Glaciimonas immobilis]
MQLNLCSARAISLTILALGIMSAGAGQAADGGHSLYKCVVVRSGKLPPQNINEIADSRGQAETKAMLEVQDSMSATCI